VKPFAPPVAPPWSVVLLAVESMPELSPKLTFQPLLSKAKFVLKTLSADDGPAPAGFNAVPSTVDAAFIHGLAAVAATASPLTL